MALGQAKQAWQVGRCEAVSAASALVEAMLGDQVNGQMRQMGSTRDMIFPVHSLVAFISSIMTLHPGDVILTGTPAGVGPLLAGDEVSVEIEGIGTLTNTVAADA